MNFCVLTNAINYNISSGTPLERSLMYRTVNIQISRDSELFEWCSHNARCANNLYNAALFRERQMMSSARKTLRQLTDNELEVMSEV